MGEAKQIVVFGAGGLTGRDVVSRALAAGHRVRAAEKGAAPDFPYDDKLECVAADVLSDDLRPVVAEADAVVSALGLPLSPLSVIDPPPLYTEGTLRMVQAMRTAGVRRIVVISATFVATRDRGPIWFRATALPALHQIFAQMGDMERILRASDGVDWTAVRPGWLLDEPFTGDYSVSENAIPRGTIRTRHADLADFMLRCATSGDWVGQTPAIARPEPLRFTGPHALMQDVLRALPHLPRPPAPGPERPR